MLLRVLLSALLLHAARGDVCMSPAEYALVNSASSCTACPAALDSSLQHWFRFEDPSALTFDSITGVGRGTIINPSATATVASPLGSALNLVYASDTGNAKFIVDSSVFQGAAWTLTFAFKVSKRQDFGRFMAIDQFLEMSIKHTGKNMRIFAYDNSGRQDVQNFCENTADADVPYDRFMFAAIRGAYDEATQKTTLTVFCDGAQDDDSANPMSLANDLVGQTVTFGGPSANFGGTDDSNIIVDDLRFYSRALSGPEIALLAQQSNSVEVEACLCEGQIGAPGSCMAECDLATLGISATQAYSKYRLVGTGLSFSRVEFYDASGAAPLAVTPPGVDFGTAPEFFLPADAVLAALKWSFAVDSASLTSSLQAFDDASGAWVTLVNINDATCSAGCEPGKYGTLSAGCSPCPSGTYSPQESRPRPVLALPGRDVCGDNGQ